MIINVLLITEIVGIIVIAISQIKKLNRLARIRVELKHLRLETTGRTLALLGPILALFLPQTFHVQHDFSDRAGLIYFFAIAIGFSVFIIGIQFRMLAYKSDEEIPKWIRRIANFVNSR